MKLPRPRGRRPFTPRERRWSSGPGLDGRKPSRSLLVALVLASISLITLDYHGGDDSPVEPVRAAAGELFGPIESGTATVMRPITAIPDWFQSRGHLRNEVVRLQAENSRLKADAASSGYDRNRLEEYDGLTSAAKNLGYALVPARVVALGPSQAFSRTVTIDAGSDSGLHPDLTVVNNDGLVGRILRVTRSTATVLLIVDADSVVGGRVGRTLEMGFAKGRGQLGDDARLDLELVDATEVPAKDDAIVTWGSKGGTPYVAGVPIGRVTSVYSSLRDTSQRVVVDPYVDFGALDLVGVVVPSGTRSDRAVIEADGNLR